MLEEDDRHCWGKMRLGDKQALFELYNNTLASESVIKLEEGFNKNNRALWLSGEAYFDIKHDSKHPFIVHTIFNDIKVLGTIFNVKAYANDKEMETSLIRGSVRVDSRKYPGKFVILKPNEKLITNNYLVKESSTSEQPFTVTVLKTIGSEQKPKEVQWVQNRLEIENEPLSLIVKNLNPPSYEKNFTLKAFK